MLLNRCAYRDLRSTTSPDESRKSTQARFASATGIPNAPDYLLGHPGHGTQHCFPQQPTLFPKKRGRRIRERTTADRENWHRGSQAFSSRTAQLDVVRGAPGGVVSFQRELDVRLALDVGLSSLIGSDQRRAPGLWPSSLGIDVGAVNGSLAGAAVEVFVGVGSPDA